MSSQRVSAQFEDITQLNEASWRLTANINLVGFPGLDFDHGCRQATCGDQ